ncbi:hypothetical protein P168DRAFT_314552 [Aspergillus campestris IBT 28561]|uniref:Mis12-Mtw1 protein n=1 Tax=Aspergillus campestris (strain IBT 28561) TaxID=1392248 RepID=A0A2I1DF09_ASPC2|nr:uncharacterized protein P168DRAFT_314552 [Aspergillus campestris IBT 28561]PKY08457.1 hypothetical protein P168DRAFT_314552 [Aspergillus campestris IBT 28561]
MTVTVLATSTTKTKTKLRDPLLALEMAPTQAQARHAAPGRKTTRSAARLSLTNQENEAPAGPPNGVEKKKKGAGAKRSADVFDEDVEGFQFTRVTTSKSKKSKPSDNAIPELAPPPEKPPQPSPRRGRPPKKKVEQKPEATTATESQQEPTKPRSTRQTRGAAKPTAPEPEPEPEPVSGTRSSRKRDNAETVPTEKKKRKGGRPSKSHAEEQRNGFQSPEPPQSGTATIALPMADTPVIQRNKEMRGAGKSGKGNRRSSLGMRGRRASSLIESGASNALPHREVDTADFFKHIASDGLPEPRRMRQLLTWCATRALSDKPTGSGAEDASARLAARVIQEELLKDFSQNSQLSDWFSREDVAPSVVVKKPNPKNTQNSEKIKELEEQIQRLHQEKQSLNALLRPPTIPPIQPPAAQPEQPTETSNANEPSTSIDTSLLDPSQQQIYNTIKPAPAPATHPPDSTDTDTAAPHTETAISARLSRITGSLAPTLDTFAAGIHDIDLYRATSDRVSTRVLQICADRLDERDTRHALRRLALDNGSEEDTKTVRPREDLGLILGALSRIERR